MSTLYIQALINATAARAKKKYPVPYPKKRDSMRDASTWTSDKGYSDTCDYMRGKTLQKPAVKRITSALGAYMKHSALVVPSVPRDVRTPTPLVLWRGVRQTFDTHAVGSTVSSNGGCFTAFSYDPKVASRFATKTGAVYRLQVDRIARGTPWIWFSQRVGLPTRWQTVIATKVQEENEVLLPPGYFKILRLSKLPSGVPLVDIAFVPRPQYVRSGAVPRLNDQGRVVVKTVGGHLLVTDRDKAVDNVRRRREQLLQKAARRVSGAAMRGT